MKKQIAKVLFINSFQKEIRNKTFWFLLVSSILVMLSSRAFFTWFSSQVEMTAIGSFDLYFYYFVTSLWSGLMMILLGLGAIKSDTRYGMAEQILAFPIRSEFYLFLRIASTTLLIWFFYLILFFMMALFLIHKGSSYPLTWKAFIAPLVFLQTVFAITTIAVFFSVILGQIAGFIAVFISIMLISTINQGYQTLSLVYLPGHIIHWCLPHLGALAQISNALIKGENFPENIKLWIEIPHYFISMGILFFATHFFLKKRNFK